MTIEAALLSGRNIIEVAGEDRVAFLQGLITNDVEGLAVGAARFAGLLSPQGKILFDFFAVNLGEALLLDCSSTIAASLRQRLTFYKLRARVTIADVSAKWRVAAAWGEGAAEWAGAGIAFEDPRLLLLGVRVLLDPSTEFPFPEGSGGYERMRIELAVPEAEKDYAYGDAFPHEACYDFLHGVDFRKGCYVGQEVVSRMQHRGTARTRILAVSGQQPLPEGGADILAGGFGVGRLGSVSGNRGIALARLDRVGEAMSKGQALTAGNVPVTLSVPSWASYSLAGNASEAAR